MIKFDKKMSLTVFKKILKLHILRKEYGILFQSLDPQKLNARFCNCDLVKGIVKHLDFIYDKSSFKF